MKRFLLICGAILCMVNADAQVCKISDNNDNVEVFSCELTNSNSMVSVVVGNDSQNTSANITITVEVVYKASNSTLTTTQIYDVKGIAMPNGTSKIEKSILSEIGNKKAYSVSVKSISGTKCH